ncbi:MAG: AbrB/MazE/SpoVT family DNA-binding domain-containing protein [Armatimonadota bacterium]
MDATAKARVTSKGQITVPREIRERLGLHPGDTLVFEVKGKRTRVHAEHRKTIADFAGLFPSKRSVSFENEREGAWRRETARLVRVKRRLR